MVYSLNGMALGIAFVIIGYRLLKKLNHHYEDIYEDKAGSVSYSILSLLDKVWYYHCYSFSGHGFC